MGKKIFKAYIINAVISGFYSLRGLFTIISSGMKLNKSSSIAKIASSNIFDKYREIANIISSVSDAVQSVMSIVNLYVYGYPSFFLGLIALMLSSIGMFCLTEKGTKKTAGYYVTMVFSYIILGLTTLLYIAVSLIIRKIRS